MSKDLKYYDEEVWVDVKGKLNLKNMKQKNDAEEDSDQAQAPGKRKLNM